MSNKFVTTDEQHARARAKHIRSQKFVTTAKQHKTRKAYHNLRSGWQTKKSAINPEWWANRQAQDPYLYHKTPQNNVSSIIRDGLYPFDAQENPRGTTYDKNSDTAEFRPRAGHVYLADNHTIDNLPFAGDDAKKLRIDTRHLNPQQLNADEDSFIFSSPEIPEDWNGPSNHEAPMWNRTLGRVVPNYVHKQYIHDYDQYGNADQTTNFRSRFEQTHAQTDPHWADYGEWANDRLNDPMHTRWSLAGNGTVAYNGHIPPEAIQYQDAKGNWHSQTGDMHSCEWCGGGVDPESNQCLDCGEKPWDAQVAELAQNPEGTLTLPPSEYEEHVAAVDPNWLQDWMAKNGPYLYHGTPTQSVTDSILKHGLYPHDFEHPNPSFNMNPVQDEFGEEYVPSRSEWSGNYLEPRPGHVYMGTAQKASGYIDPHSGGMVGIDLRKLDPNKIHADEDAFKGPFVSPEYPAAHKFYDPEHEAYDPPNTPMDWHGDMENLGQWGDRVGLGNYDPEETHHSLAHNGSVAYEGVVPPEALVPGNVQANQYDLNPWLPPVPKAAAQQSEDVPQPVADPMHIGLPIPRNAGSHILRWAKEQRWPEGTELETPNDYHITLLFTPEGHDQHSEAWWIQHLDEAHAKIAGFSTFPAAHKEGYAYVLRVESPEIDEHANKLMDSAEFMGLKPSRFPGGYKAHITVGYGPTEVNVEPPTFEFDVGPSKVSPKKTAKTGMAADPHWVDHWMDRNGPYLYHNTYKDHIPAILQNGLVPWDHPTNPGVSTYAGTPSEPRPNHVYMRSAPISGDYVRVDMRKLDPSNLNPDEDWMDNDHPQVRRMWPDIPDEGPMFHPEGWDTVNQPSQTAWSLENGNTIAHMGPIPPEAIDHPWGHRAAYMPEEAQVLDHLSLSSVAHNLHYKFEQGGLDPQGAVDYAKRLLSMIGYPDDKMTLQAAIQAWQQLYPMDKMLAEPEAQPQITSAVTRDEFGKPSVEPWTPGTWGKGLMLNGQPHVWETEGPGGSPHHQQYLGLAGLPNNGEARDYIAIAPSGEYTQLSDQTYDDPSAFVGRVPGLRYQRDRDRWQMRAFSKTAMYPMGTQDYYHVSPRSNRESILENGLTGHEDNAASPWNYDWNGSEQQPKANYVFHNSEDAKDYVFNLHSRKALQGRQPDEEDRWDWPEPPEDFDNWDWDKQDDWHANNEPTPRMDDPEGYDIWKVQGHGMPIGVDPESALTEQQNPESVTEQYGPRHWDLGQLHDAYQDAHDEFSPDYEGNRYLDQGVGSHWGNEPIRQYFPQHVPAHRLTLHEHVPSWDLTEENANNRLDESGERQYPSPWNWTPYTALPQPTARSADQRNLPDPQANYVIQKDNDEEEEEGSTEPSEVMNPADHWPDYGERNPADSPDVDTEHDFR